MPRATPSFRLLASLLIRVLFVLSAPVVVAPLLGSSAAPIPPGVIEIIEAPVGGLRSVGSPSSLTVKASGAGILAYQWFRGTATSPSTSIAGAIQSTYTIDFPTAEDTAYYSVRISNLLGEITSTPVLVSYEAPVGSLARRAASFYPGGIEYGNVNSVIPLADGGYVVAGSFSKVSVNDIYWSSVTRYGLAHIRADGTLDTGYPSFPGDVTVHAMVKDSQGRIIIAFNTGTIRANGVNVTRNGVARILANGGLDRDFVGPFTKPSPLVRCLAIDSSDRIYIGDESEVVRVNNTTGAKDPSFPGGDGGASVILPVSNGTLLLFNGSTRRVDTDIPNPNHPAPFNSQARMPAKTILLMPGSTDFLEAGFGGISKHKINNDDSPGWLGGTGPKIESGWTGSISGLFALPSGNIIAVGNFATYNDTPAYGVVHLTPAGAVAPDLNFQTGLSDIQALAVGPHGELFAGGASGVAIINTVATPAPPDPGAPAPDRVTQYLIDAGIPASRRGTGDDYDGDGAPNEWEYYIQTDPADPASVLLRLRAYTCNNNILAEANRSPDTAYYSPGTLVNMSADPVPGLTLIGWAPTDYDPVTGYAAAVSDNPLPVIATKNQSLVAFQGLPLAPTLQSIPTQTWTTGGNALWTGTTDVAAPTGGLGTARATALGKAGEEAWLQTTVNAPGILGFNWRLDVAALGVGGIAKLEVQANGVPLDSINIATPFAPAAFHIPGSGPVNVRFRLQRLMDYRSFPSDRQESAYLANFSFGPLAAPTLLPSTGVTKTSLTINWAAPVGADGYQLEFASDDAFTADVQTFAINGGITQKIIEGLASGTPYYYRVTAHGIDGSTAVSTVGTTTTVAKKAQTITFNPLGDKRPNDPRFNISATTTAPGLAIVFTISGPASISGRTITLTGAEGVVTVTANQPGDANYAAAPPISQSFTVAGVPQTITFNTLLDKPGTAAPFDLVATASSGLPVQFTLTGPATLGANGKTLTLTGEPGTVTVTATQPGGYLNGTVYTAAGPMINSFDIIPVSPTFAQKINFAPPLAKTYGDPAFTLTASSSTSLPVSFKLVSGPATLNGGELAITGAGKVVVTATQPGNGRFKPTSASRTIVINKAKLRVNTADASRLVRDANPPLTLSYTGFIGSDGYTDIATPPIATTAANPASPAGDYTISFKGGADTDYTFVAGDFGKLTVLGFGGAYEALLVDAAGTPLGKLELAVPANALSYTGTLRLAAEARSIVVSSASKSPGTTLLVATPDIATLTWTRPATPDLPALQLTVTVRRETPDSPFEVLSGTLTRAGQTFAHLDVAGHILVLPAKTILAWGGAHTFLVHPPASLDAPAPRGFGRATASIASNTGVLKLAGQLSDGAPLTASLKPTSQHGYVLWATPYGTRLDSFLAGHLSTQAHPDLSERLYIPADLGSLIWKKTSLPPTTKTSALDKTYRAGFGPLNVPVSLDPWLPPAAAKAAKGSVPAVPAITLADRLGLATSSETATAAFGLDYLPPADAAFTAAQIDGLPAALSFTIAGKPVLPSQNPAKFALTVNPATGAFSGSFVLSDPVPSPTKTDPAATKPYPRKVTFSGTLRQAPSATPDAPIGQGVFLLPALPNADSTEQLSGEIRLLAPGE